MTKGKYGENKHKQSEKEERAEIIRIRRTRVGADIGKDIADFDLLGVVQELHGEG